MYFMHELNKTEPKYLHLVLFFFFRSLVHIIILLDVVVVKHTKYNKVEKKKKIKNVKQKLYTTEEIRKVRSKK